MDDDNTQRIMVVCGAQFGSEGKGNVTGWLSGQDVLATCVRVGGPNAGHTVLMARFLSCNMFQLARCMALNA
jgi:adenylosuccinate synthase